MDEWIVRCLFRRLDKLTVRCDESSIWLRRWGLVQKMCSVPDIVFALRCLKPEWFELRKERKGLGIVAINNGFSTKLGEEETNSLLLKLVAAAAQFHREIGEPILLFTQVYIPLSDDDYTVVEILAKLLKSHSIPHEVLAPEQDLRDYIGKIASCRGIIGCRMHACILAAVSHTPLIGLAYQPKFMGIFRQLGTEEWLCPLNSVEESWICDRVSDLVVDQKDLEGHLAAQVEILESRVMDFLEKSESAVSQKEGAGMIEEDFH